MKKLLLIAAFFFFKNVSFAQYGELDPTFGIGGILKTDLGTHYNFNNPGIQVLAQPGGTSIYLVSQPGPVIVSKKLANGLPDSSYGYNGVSATLNISAAHAAIQADGKIIIAGYSSPEDYYNTKDFVVARLNTDGKLDNTFAVNGIRIDDNSYNDQWNSVVIQPDSKILLAGIANSSTAFGTANNIITIYRLNSDGSLDPGFNGAPIRSYDATYYPDFLQLTLQNDGKILVDQKGGDGQPFPVRLESDGNVDLSFAFDNNENTNGPYALQSDQKILAFAYNGASIRRFNPDGSLDNSFAVVTSTIGVKTAMIVQSDDKILLAGYTGDASGGNSINFSVERYNADGSIDNTFSGDGLQTTDFGFDDRAGSIALESNGKIVVYGSAISTLATPEVAVYNYDGTPDISFNGNGTLADNFNQGVSSYNCTAVQADGKPVAAGYTWNGTNYDFAIVRYNLNGTLDNTFSDDGKQTVSLSTGDDMIKAIAIQPDGKILVAGNAGGHFGLVRFNTDGSLDNTFDGDGMVTTNFGATDNVTSIRLAADGKILVGGSALVRYNTDGSLDLSFDGDGKMDNSINTTDGQSYAFNCHAMTIQNDQKILVASTTDNTYFVVGRYNPDGSLDGTFGYSGYAIIFFNEMGVPLIPTSMAVDNDGKAVIAGYAQDNYRNVGSGFIAIRLNTDGSMDNSFAGTGILYAGSPETDDYFGTAVVIQPDNKIILGGYGFDGTNNNFTLLRLNTNGTGDNTFSGDGLQVTPVSGATDVINGLALGNDALYAVGYGQFPGNLGVIAKYSIAAGAPLPVALTDFTAILQNDKTVKLQWQTSSEQRLAGFTIERSGNDNNFVPIGYVTAKGNSNVKINYAATDKQPLQGNNFYRLKIADTDGAAKYSKTVLINISDKLFTLKVSPNPAKDLLLIQTAGQNEMAIFQITDVNGRKLQSVKISLTGSTSFSIDVNNLPNGLYNLQMQTKSGTETRKFIKQ